MTQTALQGLKILDLSRVLAGPYATQILGDMGADIIKVEHPGSGDDTRNWGPPFLEHLDGSDSHESAYYLSVNRNKRSVAIDMKTLEGQDILRTLAMQADVVIENFKVDGLIKYGLDYASLSALNPRLIYASISGFGQTGPLAHEPGYDFLAQGMAGMMAATGLPENGPTKVGIAVSDILTGLYATIGVLGALQTRHVTGRGQHVDVALTECTLAAMTNIAQYYLTSGKVAPRLGNAHATIVPYQTFDTKDGHIIIAVGNDGQFSRLANALGHPEWLQDARFVTNIARVTHRADVIAAISPCFISRTTSEWLQIMRDVDVPCGPVNTMAEVFADHQIIDRGIRINLPHPLSDKGVDLVGSPLHFSDTPVQYHAAPPLLGQHTEGVLQEIGYSPQQVADLQARGVIYCQSIHNDKGMAKHVVSSC